MKNTTVFDNNTFRLYIPFQKYLVLENILKKENITYSIDFDLPNSVTDFVRFYFDKKNEKRLNQILMENGIESTDDFFVSSDFKTERKTFFLFLIFFGILLGCVFIYYLISVCPFFVIFKI